MSDDREIRNAPLGLRVKPSLKRALEAAAKDDRRTMAAMAELIISDWLEARGYLKPDDAQ